MTRWILKQQHKNLYKSLMYLFSEAESRPPAIFSKRWSLSHLSSARSPARSWNGAAMNQLHAADHTPAVVQ